MENLENLNQDLIHVTPDHETKNVEPNLSELGELHLSIEDKAAHLSLQVNQVIIKPYLNQALDYLTSSRDEVLTSYNNLSCEVSQEVEFLLETNRVLGLKVGEAKKLITETQTLIRNRYSDATEFEISSGSLNLDLEYNSVAENYEKSMQLSQEIIKNRMRVESLLETQKLLDESLANRVGSIQIEIDNLSVLLDNLHSAQYSGKSLVDLAYKFNNAEKLSHTITQVAESEGYQADKSLYEHIKATHLGKKVHHVASGELPHGLDNKVHVDEKELFVVRRNKPVNLAKLRK